MIKRRIRNHEYRDLAPTDKIENGDAYIDALQWALDNPRIKNIALAGPYGSGKSSIIETYLYEKPRLKCLRISMATFIENVSGEINADQDNDGHIHIPSEKIEEGILKQLFYKVDYKKIPQSRYRKLHKVGFWKFFRYLVFLLFLVFIGAFVFKPEIIAFLKQKILTAGNSLKLGEIASLSVAGLISLTCLFYLSRALRFVYAKFRVKETKVPGIDTTLDTESVISESIFDKNMDEIIYFFEETKYQVVFFEDLDRLNDPKIFVRLRELNTILNNYDAIKRRIIFVYAVKDDIFKDADRTKFFDFIIPVIPVINSTNSGEILLKMLQDAKGKGICHKISMNFINDISPYISDMRTLLNIYNEFIVYKKALRLAHDLNLSDEKMMSIIVFKNLYPRDFADIQREDGIIKQAFTNKKAFIEKGQDAIQKRIDELSNQLEAIKKETLVSAREIKAVMMSALTEWKGLLCRITIDNKTYSLDEILSDTFDINQMRKSGNAYVQYTTGNYGSYHRNIENFDTFIGGYCTRCDKLKAIEERGIDEMQHNAENLNLEKYKIACMKLSELLENYDIQDILPEDVCQNKLLVFLLRKGYISEEYANYINYFKGTSITRDDMNFILSIKNQEPLPYDYSLSKIPQVLDRLQLHEFGQKPIYNFELLDYMLSHEGYNDKLDEFITQLADGSDQSWRFIDSFIDNTHQLALFIAKLAIKWVNMWKRICEDAVLSDERKLHYLALLIENCHIDTIVAMNIDNSLGEFCISHEDILQRLRNVETCQQKEIIEALDIRFHKLIIDGVDKDILNFIFDEYHYILNPEMIQRIVEFKNPSLASGLKTQNYTTIVKLGYAPLLDRVRHNISQYVTDIVLSSANTHEHGEQIIDLLRQCAAQTDLCERIIAHEIFYLDDISYCCQDMIGENSKTVLSFWNALLKNDRIAVMWENVIKYWDNFKMTKNIITFISMHADELGQRVVGSTRIDDTFKREFIMSDMEDEVYYKILSVLRLEDFDIPLDELPSSKVDLLIKLHYFEFTVQSYKDVEATHPELLINFICKNQDQCMAFCNQISFKGDTIERIILHPQIKESLKESLLEYYGVQFMTKDIAKKLVLNPLSVSKDVFESAWKYLEKTDKETFMMQYLSILDANMFEKCFKELSGQYEGFIDRSRRHEASLPATPQNIKLAQRLKEVEYITNYDNKTRPMKTKPYIACRIKIKVQG